MKGFRRYSSYFTSDFRDFTSHFKAFKPDFGDFLSDFTDFRDFRSDFKTFVHRIPEEVGPSVSLSFT